MSSLTALSSLRLTLPGMFMLGAGVLVRYFDETAAAGWLVLPLSLLAVNLLAALLVNPIIRRQPALVLFHVCLLAIALLLAASQLGSLHARVELAEGQAFDAGSVTLIRNGAWHPRERLERVAFTQGRLRVAYNPGLKRRATESHVIADGERVVGDNMPLELSGYRFYTTSNKGYAAILAWRDAAGREIVGAVNLPSYPLNDWQQLNNWTSPGGQRLDLELLLHNAPDFTRPWLLESGDVSAMLNITVDGKQRQLAQGTSMQLGDGELRFVALRMWMGYEIRYEPLLPWLFLIAVTGVLALAWHFRTRLDDRLTTARVASVRKEDGRHVVPVAHP